MRLLTTFHGAIALRNVIFMAKCICVRGRLLFLSATVLVCRAGGKPSTWFPPGTRRAVHNIRKLIFWSSLLLEPSKSKNRKSSKFHENFNILKIIHYFHTFPWDTVRPKFAIPDEFVQFVENSNPSGTNISEEKTNLDLVFLMNSTKFWKYFIIFTIFYEHTHAFKTQVWSSTKADTQWKWNFNMIWRLGM